MPADAIVKIVERILFRQTASELLVLGAKKAGSSAEFSDEPAGEQTAAD